MVEAVLFDLDGVLVDSYEVWLQVVNGAAERFSKPPISRREFHEGWGQGIDADVETWFRGVSIGDLEACYDGLFPQFLDRLTVTPGVRDVERRLREAGVRIAVVTNTPRNLAREIIERAGLRPDELVGGTDVEHSKPAPDMVLLACRRLNVSPGDALMVGDSRYDRDAAHAAGVPFVGYRMDAPSKITELEGLLDLVAPSSKD